jgi:hypothetical protein
MGWQIHGLFDRLRTAMVMLVCLATLDACTIIILYIEYTVASKHDARARARPRSRSWAGDEAHSLAHRHANARCERNKLTMATKHHAKHPPLRESFTAPTIGFGF